MVPVPTPAACALSHAIRRSWWLILLFGLLSTLFGLMALLNPIAVGTGLTWGIGLLAVAEGIAGLISVFSKNTMAARSWLALYSLISLTFGAMAMFNPITMAESIVMVAGAWMVLSGVLRIFVALRVRKAIANEWLLIFGGVLGVALGTLLLMAPTTGLVLGAVWMGVGALVYGLLQIGAALKVRHMGQA